jgi:hypothetical protein
VLLRKGEHPIVRVLPVTRSAPSDPADALEIPQATKQRLGLDSERSWVVLSEANDFIWPGPDLRPAVNGDPSTVAYGMLPPGFMKELRERLLQRWRMKRVAVTKRTE